MGKARMISIDEIKANYALNPDGSLRRLDGTDRWEQVRKGKRGATCMIQKQRISTAKVIFCLCYGVLGPRIFFKDGDKGNLHFTNLSLDRPVRKVVREYA